MHVPGTGWRPEQSEVESEGKGKKCMFLGLVSTGTLASVNWGGFARFPPSVKGVLCQTKVNDFLRGF